MLFIFCFMLNLNTVYFILILLYSVWYLYFAAYLRRDRIERDRSDRDRTSDRNALSLNDTSSGLSRSQSLRNRIRNGELESRVEEKSNGMSLYIYMKGISTCKWKGEMLEILDCNNQFCDWSKIKGRKIQLQVSSPMLFFCVW